MLLRMWKNMSIGIVLLCWNLNIATADTLIGGAYGRCKCMNQRQVQGCTESFIVKYPNLSRSADDLTIPDTCLFLFTNEDSSNAEFLHECGGRLPDNTNFQIGKPIVIIIHGFTEDTCFNLWTRDMKNEFMKKGDYNVIIIDYSWNNFLDSDIVAINAVLIGKQVAVMIDNIKNQTGATEDDFHIVGFSLGCHIAGLASRASKVKRISVLESAYPFYKNKPPSQRLLKSDARFIDFMHTGGGECVPYFGDFAPTGDADFYVNGGSMQPSCIEAGLVNLFRGDVTRGIQMLALNTACSHLISVNYYIATINPDGCELIGTECSSYAEYKAGKCGFCSGRGPNCAIMGYNWPKSPPKIEKDTVKYYLDLSPPCPYCVKQKPVVPGVL